MWLKFSILLFNVPTQITNYFTILSILINIYLFQWKLANKNENNVKRRQKQDIPSKYVKYWEIR